MDSKQAQCHQMVEKLPVTRWQRNCHSHQMVEKLSVTRWRRNCHSHQMVEKLSQSPGSEETVTVTRWRRNCHSHQMEEKLSQSPDGGETVTVTTWWRNCHSHQKTWKSISHIATNTMLRVQNYVSRNSCERLQEAKNTGQNPTRFWSSEECLWGGRPLPSGSMLPGWSSPARRSAKAESCTQVNCLSRLALTAPLLACLSLSVTTHFNSGSSRNLDTSFSPPIRQAVPSQ